MSGYDDDFEDLFESHFGGTHRKVRRCRACDEEGVGVMASTPHSCGKLEDPSTVIQKKVEEDMIIFCALAVMEVSLLKSGYPKPIADAIRKRIHEVAKRYKPPKETR